MLLKILKTTAWLLVVGLVLATVVPAANRPVTGIDHDLEHFLAFAGVAAVFAFAHSGLRTALLLGGGAVFTLAIELAQIPLSTRHARLEDFLWDTVAVWFAVGAVAMTRHFVDITRVTAPPRPIPVPSRTTDPGA